jgi:hypothetical protein
MDNIPEKNLNTSSIDSNSPPPKSAAEISGVLKKINGNGKSPQAGEKGAAKPENRAAIRSEESESGIAKARRRLQEMVAGNFIHQDESGNMGANLVKDNAVLFVDWEKNIRSLAFSAVLPLLAIGALYAALIFWGQIKEGEGRNMISNLEEKNQQIDTVEKKMDEVFMFQKKLKTAKQLIASHIYWTDFFYFLESKTLPNLSYGSFSGGIDGKYSLSSSAGDFNEIADQLAIFKKSNYVFKAETNGGKIVYAKNKSEAKTEKAQENRSKVNFGLILEVDPRIFYSFEPDAGK